MSPATFRALLINNRNSKAVALQIIEHIRQDPSRMEELMHLFFDEDLRICQYAAMPAGMIADHNPALIYPYLERMLHNLETPHHDAVLRNTFRTLQSIEIPEELEGLAFEKAFEFLANPQNAIAIRVFSMSVCANIAKKYPELKHELIPVIEEQMPFGSAGFKNRGNKILTMLKR